MCSLLEELEMLLVELQMVDLSFRPVDFGPVDFSRVVAGWGELLPNRSAALRPGTECT